MIPMLILKSFYVLVLQIVHKGRLQIHLRKDVRVLVLMDIMLITILTLAFLYAQQISMINMDNGEYAHTLVKFWDLLILKLTEPALETAVEVHYYYLVL